MLCDESMMAVSQRIYGGAYGLYGVVVSVVHSQLQKKASCSLPMQSD